MTVYVIHLITFNTTTTTRNGHVYVITECGGATEEGTCPECGAGIGGSQHRLRDDNQVASEMDGARHAAWSQHTDDLINYGELDQFM